MALPEIAAALSATSSAIKLLKGLNDATKQVEINSIVLQLQGQLIDLSSKIITIQEEYDSLTKIKSEIESDLREERQKNTERAEYELTQIGRGSFVYKFTGSGAPAHNLCAACFDKKQKSILHIVNTQIGTHATCKLDKDHSFYL